MRDLVVDATTRVTLLTELGFAVAFGILLGTIVAKSILVTAMNLDVGRCIEQPSRLAHARPGVSPSQPRAIRSVDRRLAHKER
jgi:putative drug exporter of the RND superfamily